VRSFLLQALEEMSAQLRIVPGKTAAIEGGAVLPIATADAHEIGRNQDLHVRSIERVIRAISDRLHLPMSNEEMADIACFSPYHFNRLFHRVTGIPPSRFHYALRLSRAKDLLIETDRGITDICLDVGYNSLGTFISRFTDVVGVSPTAFRRLARELAGMTLADFAPILRRISTEPASRARIVGSTAHAGAFDGLLFIALFRRAIPEGRPAACALNAKAGTYALPLPADGLWHVLAVAVPWSTSALQLLTLRGLWRGRSGGIRVKDGGWMGSSSVELGIPRLLDPPLLAAIPLLISKFCSLGTSVFAAAPGLRRNSETQLARQGASHILDLRNDECRVTSNDADTASLNGCGMWNITLD
jgi:AraC family transcriptional regulator